MYLNNIINLYVLTVYVLTYMYMYSSDKKQNKRPSFKLNIKKVPYYVKTTVKLP